MISERSGRTRRRTRLSPVPRLSRTLRRRACRRILRELREIATTLHAGPADPSDPLTWRRVADHLGVAVATYVNYDRAGTGCLYYLSAEGVWVIELNTALSPWRQARVLVHELAHYLLRTMTPDALVGELAAEPIVCHYSGPVWDIQHAIARDVEEAMLPSQLRLVFG